MNKLLDGLKEKANLTTTENGALTHKTSKSYVLDYFTQGSALRNRDEDSIMSLFNDTQSTSSGMISASKIVIIFYAIYNVRNLCYWK